MATAEPQCTLHYDTVGASATLEFRVNDADTALAMGSGDVAVLATPRLLAWAEQATVRAVAAHLSADATSVGTEVALRHRQPSEPRALVSVTARLRKAGRRLVFDIAAYQDDRLVAEGTVHRAVVDRARFTTQDG